MNIVQNVINDFEGQRPLAEYLGVKPQALTHWLREGWFPPGRAIQLERKTCGKYKATDLAPEVPAS
jgi:DNA-binding transcriptional regulator YdaS (Cro superfamily)